jgi:hypothetical protein
MLPQVSPTILAILTEGLIWPMPGSEDDESQTEILCWKYFKSDDEKNQIIASCRDVILAEWIRQRPGTRPDFWWRKEAPEKTRRRIGGVVGSAYVAEEDFHHGIPSICVDPKNPPKYESEAAFLKRHSLLTPAEKQSLKLKDFAPESVPT